MYLDAFYSMFKLTNYISVDETTLIVNMTCKIISVTQNFNLLTTIGLRRSEWLD